MLAMQQAVERVRVDDSLLDYALEIIERTRQTERLTLGVSPRGSLMLQRAAQARAFIEGRDFCLPDDFKQLVLPVFAHRVVVNTRYATTQKKIGAGRSHPQRNPRSHARSTLMSAPSACALARQSDAGARTSTRANRPATASTGPAGAAFCLAIAALAVALLLALYSSAAAEAGQGVAAWVTAIAALARGRLGGVHPRAGAGAPHAAALAGLPHRLPRDARRHRLPRRRLRGGAGRAQHRQQSALHDAGLPARRHSHFRRALANGAQRHRAAAGAARAHLRRPARCWRWPNSINHKQTLPSFSLRLVGVAGEDRAKEARTRAKRNSDHAGLFPLRAAPANRAAERRTALSAPRRLPPGRSRPANQIPLRLPGKNAPRGLAASRRWSTRRSSRPSEFYEILPLVSRRTGKLPARPGPRPLLHPRLPDLRQRAPRGLESFGQNGRAAGARVRARRRTPRAAGVRPVRSAPAAGAPRGAPMPLFERGVTLCASLAWHFHEIDSVLAFRSGDSKRPWPRPAKSSTTSCATWRRAAPLPARAGRSFLDELADEPRNLQDHPDPPAARIDSRQPLEFFLHPVPRRITPASGQRRLGDRCRRLCTRRATVATMSARAARTPTPDSRRHFRHAMPKALLTIPAEELPRFRRELLAWFERAQRDLDWRRTRDPYRIWLSEIMLQQTRVAAVIPYYRRFLARFPTVREPGAGAPGLRCCATGPGSATTAARATCIAPRKQIVARAWRRISRAASEEPWRCRASGSYTAAAVLSIAYGEPLAVLDGNVARVLARLGAVARRSRASPRIWRRLADAAVRPARLRSARRLEPGDDGAGRHGVHAARAALRGVSRGALVPRPGPGHCRFAARGAQQTQDGARQPGRGGAARPERAIRLLLRDEDGGALFSRLWQFPAVAAGAALGKRSRAPRSAHWAFRRRPSRPWRPRGTPSHFATSGFCRSWCASSGCRPCRARARPARRTRPPAGLERHAEDRRIRPASRVRRPECSLPVSRCPAPASEAAGC